MNKTDFSYYIIDVGFFFVCVFMFFCRCESASTIRGLSGVICIWTLEASISQHPVVSIFPTDIEKVALSRLKVTAPWRTARSGLPRNVIDFNRRAGVWTIGGLPHHLVKDIRCVCFRLTGKNKKDPTRLVTHSQRIKLNLSIVNTTHPKFSIRGHIDFCNLPTWRQHSRVLPKCFRQFWIQQHMHGETVRGPCRQPVPAHK